MSVDDVAYKFGAFLRKTVDSAGNVMDHYHELSDDEDDLMASDTTSDADLFHADPVEDESDYGRPGMERYITMSFPDNSQIKWRVVNDQRSNDALEVATEVFLKKAVKFVNDDSKDYHEPTVKSAIIDDRTRCIVVVYVDSSGFNHGDVLSIVQISESEPVADSALLPKVPYNPYGLQWPWDPEDQSKYHYAARSIRSYGRS
jgi:hypothetical protein